MSEPQDVTELAGRHLDRRYPPPGHAAWREPELPASEWRAAYFVLARIALEQLDECRAALAASPAPDPGAEPENVLAVLGRLLCEGRQHEHQWSVCYDSNRLAEYALARGPWNRKGYWRTPEMDVLAPSAEPPETP